MTKRLKEYLEYRKKDSDCSSRRCETCHYGICAWGDCRNRRNPHSRLRVVMYCVVIPFRRPPIRVDKNYVCKAYEPIHCADPLPDEEWIPG